MNVPRFYCPLPMVAGSVVELPENAARHACRVLRLREGDELVLFNGSGGEYVCRITRAVRGTVMVDVLTWSAVERESLLDITLVQALQSGEKMDTTVQKAVELGVNRIVPVATRRSVLRLEGDRAEKRLAHWRGVVAAACEQCGRNRLPQVQEIQGLENWLGKPRECSSMRLMLAPVGRASLNMLASPDQGLSMQLLVGAEGGLTDEEVQQAEKAGYLAIRLGPRILRTETAGLAAIAAIQSLWGDFRGGMENV